MLQVKVAGRWAGMVEYMSRFHSFSVATVDHWHFRYREQKDGLGWWCVCPGLCGYSGSLMLQVRTVQVSVVSSSLMLQVRTVQVSVVSGKDNRKVNWDGGVTLHVFVVAVVH